MMEKIIRNLDHKTSKSLAMTIKAVLSDHIRFIRELNRILILRHEDTPELIYSKRTIEQRHFKRWFDPYKATELGNSQEFNTLVDLHIKLQIMATELAATVKQSGSIDIEQYERFLAHNDTFFELLWQLATEVIAAQYQFDSLTKLLNRRFFEPILKHELSRIKRQNNACCVVLIDIDDFKLINDNFGHDVGDSILFEFAGVIKSSIRDNDYASRHGGEEFLLCLPDTTTDMALTVMERLSKKIANHNFSHQQTLTASIGIALLADEIRKSIINADQAMYLAKNNGKNQVRVFNACPP
jgi:diguanylate cyclase (GGDEF)-like protein